MSGVFPTTLIETPDTSKYSYEVEDKAIKTEIEGGYVSSRARHTRPPRRTFKVGYTYIRDSDLTILDNFYVSMGGGSDDFTWTNPSNNIVYTVRFKTPLSVKFAGRLGNRRWDVTFDLEEV